jgi:hypothetical protein
MSRNLGAAKLLLDRRAFQTRLKGPVRRNKRHPLGGATHVVLRPRIGVDSLPELSRRRRAVESPRIHVEIA